MSEPIGQEHDTLTWIISSHVKNISGEKSSNQTHLDKIDTFAGDMKMKINAAGICVITMLGCLNLMNAAKTGYKSISNGRIIQIMMMMVLVSSIYCTRMSKHNSEFIQIFQTWVVTGGLMIACYHFLNSLIDTNLDGQLLNGQHTYTYDSSARYEGAWRDNKKHGLVVMTIGATIISIK